MIKKQLKKLLINPLNLVFVDNPASANAKVRATVDKAILCLIYALCSSCSVIQIEKGANKEHTPTDYLETLS